MWGVGRVKVEEGPSSVMSLLVRTLIPLDQGPTFMASFNLNYFLKVLSPNTVTLEFRVSAYLGRLQTLSPLTVIALYYHLLTKRRI